MGAERWSSPHAIVCAAVANVSVRHKERVGMFELEFPASEQVARIIWSATSASWSLCLGGPTWPNKEEQYERMKNPRPGDMVVEVSGGMRQFDCAGAVGWLIRTTREPVPFDDWNVEEDGPIPDEAVVYIKTIDGRDYRWVNCSFIAVPHYDGWWDAERWKDRDPLAQVDTHAERGDVQQTPSLMGSAVPATSGDAS